MAGHGGFAGFRVMDPAPAKTDWLAFQGASYFRTSGVQGQYGLSARGIAIDTAMPQPEEFPDFTAFYLERPVGDRITLYALLDGPSLTGVYRFVCTRAKPVLTEVHAELFARQDIGRLGVAPLTSMFWYGENNRRRSADWRPEIHDSDGLALWTGAGERLWRVIENPPLVMTSSFVDFNPRGFGLSQRDRNFENYQDDGAFYDRRPSVWVQPLGDWGEGAVQLVEIPTDDEIHDNLVAYWTPKEPVRGGSAWTFDYRLYWGDDEPFIPEVGRVRHTWRGRHGIPGITAQQAAAAGLRDEVRHRFLRRAAGGARAALRPDADGDRLARTGGQRACAQGGRHRSLAGLVRPVRGRRRTGGTALLRAPGRQDPDRNLAVPVHRGSLMLNWRSLGLLLAVWPALPARLARTLISTP